MPPVVYNFIYNLNVTLFKGENRGVFFGGGEGNFYLVIYIKIAKNCCGICKNYVCTCYNSNARF